MRFNFLRDLGLCLDAASERQSGGDYVLLTDDAGRWQRAQEEFALNNRDIQNTIDRLIEKDLRARALPG